MFGGFGLAQTAVSSRRGKLDGRVATSYGPKVVREAASLLSLGAERIPNPVGRGLAPVAASVLSLGAVQTPNPVGEGLHSLANDLLPFVRREPKTL